MPVKYIYSVFLYYGSSFFSIKNSHGKNFQQFIIKKFFYEVFDFFLIYVEGKGTALGYQGKSYILKSPRILSAQFSSIFSMFYKNFFFLDLLKLSRSNLRYTFGKFKKLKICKTCLDQSAKTTFSRENRIFQRKINTVCK